MYVNVYVSILVHLCVLTIKYNSDFGHNEYYIV